MAQDPTPAGLGPSQHGLPSTRTQATAMPVTPRGLQPLPSGPGGWPWLAIHSPKTPGAQAGRDSSPAPPSLPRILTTGHPGVPQSFRATKHFPPDCKTSASLVALLQPACLSHPPAGMRLRATCSANPECPLLILPGLPPPHPTPPRPLQWLQSRTCVHCPPPRVGTVSSLPGDPTESAWFHTVL